MKVIDDKDTELNQLTEQIGFFKDVLARKRPRFERSKRVQVPYEEREQSNASEAAESESSEDPDQLKSNLAAEQLARLVALEKDRVEPILSIQNLEQQKVELEQQVLSPAIWCMPVHLFLTLPTHFAVLIVRKGEH